MTTNQIMTRNIGKYDILQRTKDGFFNASYLLKQWNSDINHTRRDIDKYLEMSSTKEYINTIIEREGLSQKVGKAENQVITISYIKTGGRPEKVRYMHPMLFFDFAMWINPAFRYDVIKFVNDQMIQFRINAGDAYKRLSTAVKTLVDKNPLLSMRACMDRVARGVNYIVFNRHESEIRNQHGTETKQRELWNLEIKLAELIEDGFIDTYERLIAYMGKLWRKNNMPKSVE